MSNHLTASECIKVLKVVKKVIFCYDLALPGCKTACCMFLCFQYVQYTLKMTAYSIGCIFWDLRNQICHLIQGPPSSLI